MESDKNREGRSTNSCGAHPDCNRENIDQEKEKVMDDLSIDIRQKQNELGRLIDQKLDQLLEVGYRRFVPEDAEDWISCGGMSGRCEACDLSARRVYQYRDPKDTSITLCQNCAITLEDKVLRISDISERKD